LQIAFSEARPEAANSHRRMAASHSCRIRFDAVALWLPRYLLAAD
jgi:hypothetical protein